MPISVTCLSLWALKVALSACQFRRIQDTSLSANARPNELTQSSKKKRIKGFEISKLILTFVVSLTVLSFTIKKDASGWVAIDFLSMTGSTLGRGGGKDPIGGGKDPIPSPTTFIFFFFL